MERTLTLILLTLERISILKEYELNILTEDEANKLLERLTKVIESA